MRNSFDKIMEFVFSIEGGYVNDPADPGGETNMGISKRTYPNEDIKGMTQDRAKEIYRKDYWDKCECDALPYPLDMCVMDTAVNMGIGAAKDLLRDNKDHRDYLLARIDRYLYISQKNATLQKFFRGWIIRVNRLKKICVEV